MLPVECIVRGYITGLGLEGLPGHRARSRASRCRTGLQESEQLPEPIYTPSTKAEEGHDEAIDFDETVRLRGLRGARGAAARRLDRGLQGGRRARARARRDPRRHEVRVRARCRRRPDAGRRGLHAGLLALLAGGHLRGRPRPAVVRQAVRARLGDRRPAGTSSRPRRRSRTTWSRRPASATSRPTSGSRASRSARGWTASREGPRADPAQGRNPRSAGPGRRARAARAGLRGRRQRARRPAGRARRAGRVARCRRCARSCSPTR